MEENLEGLQKQLQDLERRKDELEKRMNKPFGSKTRSSEPDLQGGAMNGRTRRDTPGGRFVRERRPLVGRSGLSNRDGRISDGRREGGKRTWPGGDRRDRLGGTDGNRGGRDFRGRIMRNDSDAASPRWTEDSEQPRKRRLLSAVSIPTEDAEQQDSADENAKERSPAENDSASSRESRRDQGVVPRKTVGPDGQGRNRRIFGALMGHLGKAKARLEKDSKVIRQQESRAEQAHRKNKEEASRLADAERVLVAKQQQMEVLMREALMDRKECVEVKIRTAQWMKRSRSIRGFLKTVTYPPLYYLPAKHTEATRSLLSAAQEALEEAIQKRMIEDEETIATLEASAEKKEEESDAIKRTMHVEAQAKIDKMPMDVETEDGKDLEAAQELESPVKEKVLVQVRNDSCKTAEEANIVEDNLGESDDKSRAQLIAEDSSKGTWSTEEAVVEPDVVEETVSEDEKIVQSKATSMSKRTKESNADDPQDETVVASEELSLVEETQTSAATPDSMKTEAGLSGVTGEDTVKEALPDDNESLSASYAEAPGSPDASGPINTEDGMMQETPTHKFSSSEEAIVTPSSLKVVELKAELQARGLPTSGRKSVLVKRLEDAMMSP